MIFMPPPGSEFSNAGKMRCRLRDWPFLGCATPPSHLSRYFAVERKFDFTNYTPEATSSSSLDAAHLAGNRLCPLFAGVQVVRVRYGKSIYDVGKIFGNFLPLGFIVVVLIVLFVRPKFIFFKYDKL